jgi:hypothetical protein
MSSKHDIKILGKESWVLEMNVVQNDDKIIIKKNICNVIIRFNLNEASHLGPKNLSKKT